MCARAHIYTSNHSAWRTDKNCARIEATSRKTNARRIDRYRIEGETGQQLNATCICDTERSHKMLLNMNIRILHRLLLLLLLFRFRTFFSSVWCLLCSSVHRCCCWWCDRCLPAVFVLKTRSKRRHLCMCVRVSVEPIWNIRSIRAMHSCMREHLMCVCV